MLNKKILSWKVLNYKSDDTQNNPITGEWTWKDGSRVEFYENGQVSTFGSNKRETGTKWELIDKEKLVYRITWRGGQWVDTLTLDYKNLKLAGRNQFNAPVSGTYLK